MCEIVMYEENYGNKLNLTERYKKIYKTYSVKNYHDVERSIRYLHQMYMAEIRNFFKIKGKLTNDVFVKLVHREVKRRESIY